VARLLKKNPIPKGGGGKKKAGINCGTVKICMFCCKVGRPGTPGTSGNFQREQGGGWQFYEKKSGGKREAETENQNHLPPELSKVGRENEKFENKHGTAFSTSGEGEKKGNWNLKETAQ